MKAISLLAPLLTAVYVSAHGMLTGMTVDGQSARGAVRKVSSQDPNYGAGNPALTCGPNSKPAGDVAAANPGSTLSFEWKTAGGTNWPHNTGPMLTYLASCGDGGCKNFNANNAKWFKINQVGRKPNSGKWFQEDLMSGASVSVKLPNNVAPGEYLVRHEIIALHLATRQGGAEFYPGCAQIKIGGNGTGRPTQNELASFPGYYKDSDPGIFAPNVFDSNVPYVFPGPPVAALAGGSSAGNNNGNGNNNGGSPTSTSAAPAKTGKTGGKSGSCKLKKRGAAADPDAVVDEVLEAVNAGAFQPRHISRIMRRLAFDLSH